MSLRRLEKGSSLDAPNYYKLTHGRMGLVVTRATRHTPIGLFAVLLLGCSSPSFTTSPSGRDGSASGGSGGASGGSATGGAGGGSATGGAGGSSATGGGAGADAGKPCSPDQDASCGAGQYCPADARRCEPCTALRRLQFAQPEPLTGVNNEADGETPVIDLSAPRALGQNRLLYGVSTGVLASDVHEIRYSPDFTKAAKTTIAFPAGSGHSEPLYLPGGARFAGVQFNFAFDQTGGADAGTGAHLFAGSLSLPSTSVTGVIRLPPPLNDSVKTSYAIAVAPDAGRVFWMEGPEASLDYELFTASLANPNPQQVHLTVANNCAASFYLDATPWATPDGSVLFFRSVEQTKNCTTAFPYPTDLYYARVNPDGTVDTAATRLAISLPNTFDSGPSLSPDLCWLYFASNRVPGHMRLYRAHRD